MNRTLEHILPKVQKPARYTGGEYNAVVLSGYLRDRHVKPGLPYFVRRHE